MHMNKLEIFEKLKSLPLDKEKFVVISGASLVAHGICEETSDIDLCTSLDYYNQITWQTKPCKNTTRLKFFDVFEISDNYFSTNMDFDIINGFKFMTLKDVLILKKQLNRDKDKEIIKKLENLLN